MTDEPNRLVTLEQAAAILCLSEKTIRRYIAEGHLTGYRVGPRAVRLKFADVEALVTPMERSEELR